MRKKSIALFLIIGITLLVSLAGCKSKKAEEDNKKPVGKVDEKSETSIEDDKEKIMQEFRNMVKSHNEPMILVKFIDENIEKMQEKDAVEMIKSLEEVQEEYLEKYTEQLFTKDYQMELISLSGIPQSSEGQDKDGNYENLFFDEAKTKEIKNGNLKELMEKIIKGKYKLINMEGSFYPIVDYEALKSYDKYLSDEIKDYLEIKSMDSNVPTMLDAELLISFDELAERIIKTEEHIIKYPEGIKYEELLRLYGVYLKFYLQGSDNTPIYDNETKIIKDEVLSSYKKVAGMRNAVTPETVSKYIDIIEENQNIIDNNVLSKITELYNSAIAKLEEHK
jgi:hypothetical protein